MVLIPALKSRVQDKINCLYPSLGLKIENGQLKDALDSAFEFVRYGNKYFDSNEPWKTRTSNPGLCADTLFNCIQIIANLSVMLQPFLPFSSEKVFSWLGVCSVWRLQNVSCGYVLPEFNLLFERLDKRNADDESAIHRANVK